MFGFSFGIVKICDINILKQLYPVKLQVKTTRINNLLEITITNHVTQVKKTWYNKIPRSYIGSTESHY